MYVRNSTTTPTNLLQVDVQTIWYMAVMTVAKDKESSNRYYLW